MSGSSTKSKRWTDWVEPDRPAMKSIFDAPEPDPWTHVEPLFPITSFTPESECPHRGPIPEGSSFVCMVCSQAGKDGWNALPLDVQPLPADPEPTKPPKAPDAPLIPESAKQRKRRLARAAHAVA